MFNLTGVLKRAKKAEYDDFFFFDGKKTRISIKTADDQVYILTNYRYNIFVENLNEQEYLLRIIIDKSDTEETSSSIEKIVVKKGQYIKLKQDGQYQAALKKRAEKYNQLPINRLKNWAKNIWDAKKNDIIVGTLFVIITLLFNTLAC